MDNSILAARHKQFKVIYRFVQMVDKGKFLLHEAVTMEELIERYKSLPHYQEMVETQGQPLADVLTWWTTWIVFLYQQFGPGKSEAAWAYYLEFIKQKEGEEGLNV